MVQPPVHELPTLLADAARDFLARSAGLDDAALAEPSLLPGWDRAHVLAHVEGVSRAVCRQLDYAARGELIEFYDGGFDGRNQDIETRAQRPAAEQAAALNDAVDQVVTGFSSVEGSGWVGRISYRDGTVLAAALALWRELVIHGSDLDTGATPLHWSDGFCRHLVEFLAPRVPNGLALKLQPLGQPPVTIGAGERTVVVTGRFQDISAWLAGRDPVGGLAATAAADGVALPELLPWPAAGAPK